MKKILLNSLSGMLLIAQLSFGQQDLAGNWQGMIKMGSFESRAVRMIRHSKHSRRHGAALKTCDHQGLLDPG